MNLNFNGVAQQPNWLGLVHSGMEAARVQEDRRRQMDADRAHSAYLLQATGEGGGTMQPGQSSTLMPGDGLSGAPSSGGPAWQRLVELDPKRATDALAARTRQQFDLTKLDATKLELMRQYNDAALEAISGATDEASYSAAVESIASRFEPHGFDVRLVVPATYPGERGMRRLMLQGLRTKERLAALNRQDVTDWNQQDDIVDNERADRNLASVIEDRNARRGLVARGQDLTDARGRYGIAATSADRRRGQDIASADRHRGQDLTDARTRQSAPRQRGAVGLSYSRYAEDGKGNRLGWNGKAWVTVPR